MDGARQIVFYRIFGRHDNSTGSLYERYYRATYSKKYLKRIYYQMWNTNSYSCLTLEKITMCSVHGYVDNDAIHHEIILWDAKSKKTSWM